MMSDGIVAAAKKGKPPTTILVPPRGAMESMFMNGSGPGFSPGPMTLISSFFSDSEQQSGSSSFSFSQLLAGAMASPMQQPDLLWTNADSAAAAAATTSEDDGEKSSESGYKKNRPSVNLVLDNQSQSPLFMVPPGLTPSGFLNSPLQSPFGMSHQQALAHVTAQAALSQTYIQMQAQLQPSSSTDHYSTCTNHIIQTEPDYLKIESPQVSQSDRKAAATATDKPANDGYNWRKYGQKQVKASECPRSYYKCTHLNCSVKKKVERSCDGRISEITYKGEHTHDPPQAHPTKRGKDNTSTSQAETNRSNEEAVHVHCEPEISSSTAQFEFENHPITGHGDENGDNPILLDYGYDDEPAPKRRSMDTVPLAPTSSHHTITESKIVVQTRSEVDYLDDGYKWRKYGQKVVKGNPNPRSYYRCTFAGCNVRKHVERASADPKSVVTTYEGKHNHDIPTGRFRGHASAQQVKTQKVEPKSRSLNEMDLWNKDQIPMTLHLKEEQLAA